MSSVCVSKVTNVMARWQSTRQQKQQTMQSLREYCTSHGIDVSQILSMKRYAERELARKAAYEAHTNLLQTFSSSMLKTLLHQARRSFLHYHKDFAAWCAKSDVLEFNICNKAMKEQYNMKYDSIFMASDHAEGMYLMATAQCSYEFDTMPIMPRFGTNPASNPGTRCCLWRLLSKPVDELEENIVRLGSGDFISEHALWVTGWSHRGRLQVIADGWVLALPTCSLMETLKEQPNVIECVVSFAKKYAQALNLMTESNDEKLSDLPFCTESENGSSRGLNSRGLNSRGLNSRGLKSHRLQGRSVLPKPIP
ncbi:unnamed protein product [Symbiodinium pilosum]|uniref:Cyclic nucleotide-binding domain-containing protein n=1 Tax=Symbiodinium pilosum TaxID=2952 RepID=A0A812Y023_SYMPI|nr:unnamed protein product [Symbiodinium pilosum]